MSLFARTLRGKLFVSLCIVIAYTLLTGCARSTKPSLPSQAILIVTQACPFLSPLADPAFGATTLKLIDVSLTYTKCREAALQSLGAAQEAPTKEKK